MVDLFNTIFTYPILNGLMLLYHLFGDFGLSIVVLTLIIKLVLFPLTLQQLRSMKANQVLQPKMAEIRKKHSKDQQAQAAAMQALYKEHGVNPLAGCLPLLIQLPMLYGLFYAFETVLKTSKVNDINSHLYPFVPHFSQFPNIDLDWFTFLNPSLHFSLGQPDPTHVLPILAGLATFIQLRMSQPKTAPNAPVDQATQSMKMMQYIMPFVTVFFGWTFPAGLALYWTVSYTFQAVQQFFVTGWGSLLVTPRLSLDGTSSDRAVVDAKSNGVVSSKIYADDQQLGAVKSDDEVMGEGNGSAQSKPRTVSRVNGNEPSSYTRRRQRSSSASARRRSSTQRSRS